MSSNQPDPPASECGSNEAPSPAQDASAAAIKQEETAESNKRAAMAGQWRTPPNPFYTSNGQSGQPQQQQPVAPAPPPPAPTSSSNPAPPPTTSSIAGLPAVLPGSSEDYHKALQEAYRRGAEAAAAMAAQQQQHMTPSASCPNFQMTTAPPPAPPSSGPPQHAQQHHPIVASRSEDMTTSYAPPPPPHAAAYHMPPGQPVHYAPPPPPQPSSTSPTPMATTTSSNTSPTTSVPNPLSAMPPPPKQPPKTTPPSQNNNNDNSASSKAQRSVSMPDMSSYAQQAEDEKRQKRLARNRASARLRRLRKKNLVDAYETEVGILEKTLQQLKAHEWGCPTSGPAATAAMSNAAEKSHQSLLEALCMDRGQQVISAEQRAQQCQDILEQQLEHLELLRQVQLEQQLLAEAAALNMGIKAEEDKEEDDEMAEMARELQQVLGLSPEQNQQLNEASSGLGEEITALDTVFNSLVLMKDNEWLLNQGVQDITDQLTSILHKNQMSKFLLWADANVEAIDQLDHVHAEPDPGKMGANHHPQGPIFTFGVETTSMEDDDGK